MGQAYTQIPNPAETIDLAENQMGSKANLRDPSSPHPQESRASRLLSDVVQLYPSSLRPPPRSYISLPLSSTKFSFPNTFGPDSPLSLSSKAHKDGLLATPHGDHQQRASSGSRLLFRLPDENGVLSSGEKFNIMFGSRSTRHSSISSSAASSPLLPLVIIRDIRWISSGS